MDDHPSSIEFFPNHCIVPKSGSKDHKDGASVLWIARGHTVSAHRITYQVFIGSIPESMAVMQSCNNRACVNPKHLVLLSSTEITQKTAKILFGEKRYNAKLTAEIVRVIRASNMTDTALAATYGVSRTCIARVRTGKSWKHVKTIKESENVYN